MHAPELVNRNLALKFLVEITDQIMRHFIGFPHLLYICLFPKHNLFPHSPASLLCPSSASLTVVWLIRTGDHTCRLVLSTSGLFRWPLQKEKVSLIFVKLPGWGIPLKTKARIIGSEGQCSPDRRKHGAAQQRFYIQEIILTSNEKARQL